MTMAKHHVIETTLFDIAFGDEEAAFEQQPELSNFVRRDLMPVVNELFNETAIDDATLRIETLEVDLGVVNYADYQDELPRRLREELGSLLESIRAELRLPHQEKRKSEIQLINQRSNERQQIEYFLLHGCLPWYSTLSGDALTRALTRLINEDAGWFAGFIRQSRQHETIITRLAEQFPDQFSEEVLPQLIQQLSSTESPGAYTAQLRERVALALVSGSIEKLAPLWKEVLDKYATLLEEQLYHYGQQARVRKRIAFSFPEPFIRDIITLLEPVEHGFVESIVDHSALFNKDAIKTAQNDGLAKKQLWEFSLGYLLVERGSRFNRRAYLGSLVRQMAAHDNMDYRQLLGELSANVGQLSGLSNVVIKQLQQLLTELAHELGDRETSYKRSDFSAPVAEEAENAVFEQQLREMITSALISGDLGGITPFWKKIRDEYAPLLEELLYHHGQQIRIRRQIAFSFPVDLIHDIFMLLEPVEHTLISSIVDHAVLFKVEPIADDDLAKKQLIEFSLGYLLVERGSRFNRKSYLSSLVRQMAAHENMSYRQLLGNISSSIAHLPGQNGAIRQIQMLLTELTHELGDHAMPDEAANHAIVESYSHYETLKQLFEDAGANRFDNAVIVKTIVTLAQHHPALLLKLYRQLQGGTLVWRRAVDKLPASLLSQLITAFMGLLQADMTGRSDLHDAIVANAARCHNLQRYYREVLSSLLAGKMIDFDIIMSNSQSATIDSPEISAAGTTTQSISDSEPQHPDPIDHAEMTTVLRLYLLGDEKLSPSATATLIKLFELISTHQPQSFGLFLKAIIQDQKAVGRLLDLLPERLLARCLLLLHINDNARLLLCADLVTSACYTGEVVAEPALLPRLKWQFIFSYLCETGGFFNERDFVQRYITRLMEESQQADSQLFRARLSQQLVQNTLPSTRDATVRIMDAVTKTNVTKKSAIAVQDHPKSTPVTRHEEKNQERNQEPPLESIYITNAGMVLAAPYLPRLFQMQGLTGNSAFINREAAMRATHMLQFLVNGSTSSPEYLLVLNKFLCGIKTGEPIEREIELNQKEKEVLEGLLQGMIQNWKVLGNTSVAGLRETFLQREGRLQLKNDAWHLLVEPRTFDMLLDQLPWSYSTIKYPWMERVIYVEWR